MMKQPVLLVGTQAICRLLSPVRVTLNSAICAAQALVAGSVIRNLHFQLADSLF
jgi:hypothetical protein